MKKQQRKPRGGQLVWRESKGWCARIPVTIDGERVRKLYALDTRDKTVARRKMARLVAETADKSYTTTSEVEVAAARGDLFDEACERVHQLRLKAGVKNARAEVSMLRRFAMPLLEGMEIAAVETKHVNMVLDHVASLGLGRESLSHMKQALRAVFKQLKREGEIRENPVIDSELPRLPAVARRERVLMSDDELGQYLEYRPESDRDVAGVLERQTMAAVSRMFGGLRTGDLHALDWATHIDTEAFVFGVAPREKTATPQLLVIPELLRPTLRAWWESHGCPSGGPVFPQRQGKQAGEQRNRQSHAKALRRDLRRMMGVERRVTKTRIETRHNALAQVRRTTWQLKPKAEWTRRERELFAETNYSLPVDFHSFRRAFNTGLAEAGVNIQEAMRLAGHTSASAHMRYVMSRVREVPEAALPRIGIHGHGSRALSAAGAAQSSAASDGDESGDVTSPHYGTDNEPCAPFTPATRVQIPQGTQPPPRQRRFGLRRVLERTGEGQDEPDAACVIDLASVEEFERSAISVVDGGAEAEGISRGIHCAQHANPDHLGICEQRIEHRSYRRSTAELPTPAHETAVLGKARVEQALPGRCIGLVGSLNVRMNCYLDRGGHAGSYHAFQPLAATCMRPTAHRYAASAISTSAVLNSSR